MAEQLKQIREFTTLPDFGDNDLLLAQSAGTTYNVKGQALKAYAIAAAKAQADAAQAAKEAALAAQAAAEADRIAAESAASGAGEAETGAEEAKAVAEQARAAAQSAQAAADAAKAAAEAAAAQAESVILGKIPDGSLEEAKLTASAVAKLNGNHLHGMAQIDGLDAALSKRVAKYTLPDGVDLDTVIANGHYYVTSNPVNYPHGDSNAGNYGLMLVISSNDGVPDAVEQQFTGTDNRTWCRRNIAGTWSDWKQTATATPPVEHNLPLAEGWKTSDDFGDGIRYGLCGDGRVQIMGIVTTPSTTTDGQQVATLPIGYRPVGRQAWITAVSIDGIAYNVRVAPEGNIYIWYPTLAANITLAFPAQAFYTGSSAQSASSQMRIPVSRMARTPLQEEPVTKCMCVVDADGNYVEFVIVTITYDELGALYTVHYYELKDGERLVDSQTAPAMRPHAGAPGLVRSRWDDETAAWVEGATAAEIAAWEAEHPAPTKTADQVRTQRDKLLAETDWTQVLDAPIDAVTREAYRAYRQALRDIPEQPEFPGEVVWPELPAVGKAAPDPVDAAFDELIGGESNA